MNTFNLLKRLLLTITLIGVTLAAVPRTISYQGVLKDDSGVVLNGTHTLIFTLDEDSGTMWVETHGNIEIVDGLFSVILGSTTPLNNSFDGLPINFDNPYTLSISVDGGATMGPIELTSSPYSLNAYNAEQVKGDNIFSKDGNVGIGTTSFDAKLSIFDAGHSDTPGEVHKLQFGGSSTPLFGFRSDSGNDHLVLDKSFFHIF